MFNPSEFSVGDTVQVSNGQPKPPKHHSKKLGNWECSNYQGYVRGVNENEINVDPTGSGVMCYVYQSNSNMNIIKA